MHNQMTKQVAEYTCIVAMVIQYNSQLAIVIY